VKDKVERKSVTINTIFLYKVKIRFFIISNIVTIFIFKKFDIVSIVVDCSYFNKT